MYVPNFNVWTAPYIISLSSALAPDQFIRQIICVIITIYIMHVQTRLQSGPRTAELRAVDQQTDLLMFLPLNIYTYCIPGGLCMVSIYTPLRTRRPITFPESANLSTLRKMGLHRGIINPRICEFILYLN